MENPAGPNPTNLALHPFTIEKTFTDCVMDLKQVIVLDGIDILPNNSGTNRNLLRRLIRG